MANAAKSKQFYNKMSRAINHTLAEYIMHKEITERMGGLHTTYKLNTKYGHLNVHIDSDKSELYHLHTRFTSEDLPAWLAGVNPHSGKWNHYLTQKDNDVNDVVDYFYSLLAGVCK